jgi:ubiquinone/menaquinone biosynthesis C-methylase UbiE
MVADVSDCRLPGFIKASGTDLPFADASFDVVSAFDVLEHVPKAERPAFLAELGRIASRTVLVSCPTKSPGVERAEALLNAEILRQYGIEHGMLVEHRTFGLPLEEDVGAALEEAGLTAVSFGYGALSTWLAYQAFRSSFLIRTEASRATEAIDRYWAGQPQAAELSAPFYRRYWIAMKTKSAEAGYLSGLEKAMKEQLKKNGLKPIFEKNGKTDAFDPVERVSRDVLARPFVSAVVATTGEPAFLGPCLDTLLTQIVDFDLEIAVWNFEKRGDTAAWLAAHYPQVRMVEGDFAGVAGRLRGDYIFLVDEKLLPTSDAVSRYVGLIQPEAADSVLAVSAPWRGGFPTAWTGMARSAWKKSKGLSVKAGIVGDTSKIGEDWEVVPKFKGWVIGDALFFRRIAVHSRKTAAESDRNSIFLWEFK